jgi:hypothetical protein
MKKEGTPMAERTSYHLKGVMLGACNCNWGCPCNFEAPPTNGFCEGAYLWHVQEGGYGQVGLNDLNFAWCARSPAALHLGNVTSLYLVDERATPAQRRALEELLTTDPTAMPFSVFKALTSSMLGIRYVPFTLELKGTRSRASAGDALDVQLAPMKNPVTGDEEPATLLKPKGFTSQRQELCATSTFRLAGEGLSYEHSGKYGEFSTFEYRPAA